MDYLIPVIIAAAPSIITAFAQLVWAFRRRR